MANDDSSLTDEESFILEQMTHMKKWDALSSDLAILIPTMLVAVYGIWTEDHVISSIGIGLYILLRLRTSYYQDRHLKALQTGIRKLLAHWKTRPDQ